MSVIFPVDNRIFSRIADFFYDKNSIPGLIILLMAKSIRYLFNKSVIMKTLLLSLLTVVLLVSCQKSKDIETVPGSEFQMVNPPEGYTIPDCISETETPMLAAQTINVGSVLVWNDDNNVYVSYILTNGNLLRRTHLYVGACNSIPVNNAGNPRIGLYPYSTDHGTAGVAVYTYTIPRSNLPTTELCISSHAEVITVSNGNQTGWGQGVQINDGGSWAMKFGYIQQNCEENTEIR